jgi:hypothetical protein
VLLLLLPYGHKKKINIITAFENIVFLPTKRMFLDGWMDGCKAVLRIA